MCLFFARRLCVCCTVRASVCFSVSACLRVCIHGKKTRPTVPRETRSQSLLARPRKEPTRTVNTRTRVRLHEDKAQLVNKDIASNERF